MCEEEDRLVYFIDSNFEIDSKKTMRVGALHAAVYYGNVYRTEDDDSESRSVIHSTRSGRFRPTVFTSPNIAGIGVAPELVEQLKGIENLTMVPIYFEHLVDLEMPELGDFSWETSEEFKTYGGDPLKKIKMMPHCPSLESSFQNFQWIVPASLEPGSNIVVTPEGEKIDVGTGPYRLKPHDLRPNFRTYCYESNAARVRYCQNWKFHKRVPALFSDALVLDEAVFEIIAPYLSYDFQLIHDEILS